MNDLFLKVHNVTGESKDANHPAWINIHAYTWGVTRSGNGPGMVNYHNLMVRTTIDKSTPALMLFASNGNRIRKAELSACKAGDGQIEYYRITLENVMVSEVLFDDSGLETEVEYEFQAETVKLQYWEQHALGGRGAETRAGWNIKHHTSSF
ncbi:type VI secretion system tube protein Hcp [Paramixta manurensis]|uniref:Type VI secretion system tube protein Hcp n=1 Tax=Paramixta manurensis TaxID=2740817 RepID=A0A6M8UI99_9GAMM|nr:type VI secretion system tube protein Hcp [Erwiniaceae bacterium PD-1]